jgi:lipid II:glycine glycyltransferase (peptidoglycan interpeptide bridge formation enzyme)
VTFHQLPLIGGTVGYLPKGALPTEDQLAILKELGQRHHAVFIKLEPSSPNDPEAVTFLLNKGLVPGRPLFTKYTFQLDLTPSEEDLFAKLESKTRYNVNVAYKKGVQIFENTTADGLEQHLKILKETTNRQGFYAHNPEYFRTMWQELKDKGMMRILEAHHEGKVLVSWIVFIFNNVLYYPYGASSSENRNVMASNLMMWEAIKYGKANGCTLFDMWGSLGPDPDKNHAWYGFHRFKKGYGGELIEFIGTFDYPLDYPKYQLFTILDTWRWRLLKLRAKLPF